MDKIFRNMDRDKDAKLTYEEFVEGSKQDPTIVQVRLSRVGNRRQISLACVAEYRHYRYMTGWYSKMREPRSMDWIVSFP